tara:strand:+ start:185 stop:445 length:261 start_codon:yes stop_codon:yes gene_type:complete
MNIELKLIIGCVVVGVAFNLVLPIVVQRVATKEQISPPNGANNLPFVDQVIHMFVHHAQVPVSSSVIIAIIVAVSVYGGKYLVDYL